MPGASRFRSVISPWGESVFVIGVIAKRALAVVDPSGRVLHALACT